MTKLNRLSVERRIQRKPTVLDLFAGCGGLSLGFLSEGFRIVAGIEIDEVAAKTFAINFLCNTDKRTEQFHSAARDIITYKPRNFLEDLGKHGEKGPVDVIVGGPPCQAFARVGRSKLREVAAHPEAYLRDARGNLYLRYLDYVRELKPRAILIENVPDVLNYGGHNIAEEICEVLEDVGYKCNYTLLNAAFYGVPQMRERMFLIAYSQSIKSNVVFPKPTHWIDLPVGYKGSRSVALKTLNGGLFNGNTHYVDPPIPERTLSPAVTAKDALDDLPPIFEHLTGGLRRGTRRLNGEVPYLQNDEISSYAKEMKSWPGFEESNTIPDHVIRCLPRDYEIFRRMKPGDQYPKAYQHALNLLEEKLSDLEKSGVRLPPGSSEYESLRKQTVPPYDLKKFPNKWRKMEAGKPARTLMAHLGKDGYSHIHYDSNQARTISVREAARLQSFPDGFRFEGTMNPAFRQIGNAVPPLLAAALAREMFKALQEGMK